MDIFGGNSDMIVEKTGLVLRRIRTSRYYTDARGISDISVLVDMSESLLC
jgi:hypothetical protein